MAARHLVRMAIDKVSLVDAGANARRFAVLKRAEGGTVGPAEVTVQPGEIIVAKASDPFDALRGELWRVVVAKDPQGRPLSLVQKRAAFVKACSRYQQEAPVEKAGRPQLSAARLAQLSDVHRILGDLIAGAQPKQDGTPQSWWDSPADVAKEAAQMDPKEMVEAMRPLIDEAVEKAVAEKVAKTEPEPTPPDEPGDEDAVTMAQVVAAVTKLADRVEAMEASRSQALPGVAEAPVKKSALSGIL